MIRRAALTLLLVATACSPVALLEESPPALPACVEEDSTGCVWSCLEQGNRVCGPGVPRFVVND